MQDAGAVLSDVDFLFLCWIQLLLLFLGGNLQIIKISSVVPTS